MENNIINKDRIIEQTDKHIEKNDKNIFILYISLALSIIIFLSIILYAFGQVNDRILKSLWNYCKTKIKKGGPKKSDWEKLQKEIRDYIEREFPDNSVKYIKYLDSTLRGVGLKLFGGKRHKTNKKINNINRSRTKMSRKTY